MLYLFFAQAYRLELPQEATRLKLHTFIGCFVCIFGLTSWSHGQAVPAASRSGRLQVGAGVTYARPDFSYPIKGISVYGDYDFTGHIGVEGDLHFVNLFTPADISEDTYLIGPRFVFHHRRFSPYAKALFGLGRFGYQYPSQWGHASTYTYGVYAFGGGLDLRATRHLNIRPFDIEFQRWPGFKNDGLTPIVMTFGAAYTFH